MPQIQPPLRESSHAGDFASTGFPKRRHCMADFAMQANVWPARRACCILYFGCRQHQNSVSHNAKTCVKRRQALRRCASLRVTAYNRKSLVKSVMQIGLIVVVGWVAGAAPETARTKR